MRKNNITLKKIMKKERKKNLHKAIKNEKDQSPPKFLNPFNFHRTMSDLILFDKSDFLKKPYVSSLNVLLNLKYVPFIESKPNYVMLKLEDSWNHPLTPLSFLIEILSRYCNNETHCLANSLLEYTQTFNLITQSAKMLNNFDTLCPTDLLFLKKYFENLVKNSMAEKDFWPFLEKFQENYKYTPNFCMIYDEFRPFVGLQLRYLIINKAFKKILPFDEFTILENEQFLSVDSSEYFEVINQTIKKMYSFGDLGNAEFFVQTKIGMKKMVFEMNKLYINTNKGKKVAIFYNYIEDQNLDELNKILKFLEKNSVIEIDNVVFKKSSSRKIEKNERWKQLIDLYYNQTDKRKDNEQ